MITLNDLSAEEVQYLRSKWNSEKTELTKERARKLDRLNDRLEQQSEDADVQTGLEAKLAFAQSVHAQLVADGVGAELIAGQLAVVEALQAEVDGFGLSSSFVSNSDAMRIQVELDELEYAQSLRVAKITEIDAL